MLEVILKNGTAFTVNADLAEIETRMRELKRVGGAFMVINQEAIIPVDQIAAIHAVALKL